MADSGGVYSYRVGDCRLLQSVFFIGKRGVFNVVPDDPVIGAFVWAVFFGLVAFCGGLAVDALEKSSAAIPKTLGWILLILAFAGIVLVPISGFWLVFPPALGILRRKTNN